MMAIPTAWTTLMSRAVVRPWGWMRWTAGAACFIGGCPKSLVSPGAGTAQGNLLRGWGQCLCSALVFAHSADGVWSC